MIRGRCCQHKVDYLSISEIASRNECVIMLKAYYDASNKVNVKKDKFVTFAGVISTVPIWRSLEKEWLKVLRQNNAPEYEDCTGLRTPYFHTEEAVHGAGGYESFGKQNARILMRQLAKSLSKFQYSNTPFKDKLVCVACTIERRAYDKAARQKRYLPTMAELCVSHCVGIVLRLEQSRYGISLNFDKSDKISEPFFDVVNEYIGRTGKSRPLWINRVRHHGYIDNMRKCPAVQVADLFAWSARRFCEFGNKDRWREVYLNTALHSRSFNILYDDYAFSTVFDKLGRVKKNAKIRLLPTGTNIFTYLLVP